MQDQHEKAKPFYEQALAIMKKVLGANHPYIAVSLNNLALVCKSQAEAEPLFLRVLEIREKALGADHPDTAQTLHNLAALYYSQRQYGRAEGLHLRALEIREKALGPDHPDTAQSQHNLATLYHSQGLYAKAEPLYERALEIREKALGSDHPDTATSVDNLVFLLLATKQESRALDLLIKSWPKRIEWLDRSLRLGRESFRQAWVSDYIRQFSLLAAMQRRSAELQKIGFEAVLKTKARVLEETVTALNTLKGQVDDASARLIDALEMVWREQQQLDADSLTMHKRERLYERKKTG